MGSFFKIISVSILMLTSVSPLSAQCIQVEREDYSPEIIENGNLNSLEIRINSPDINLNDFEIQLYDFDKAVYYIDETRSEDVLNVAGITYQKSGSNLRFDRIPAGDYGVILVKDGCDKQIFGYGYSGFPYSAIRIGN